MVRRFGADERARMEAMTLAGSGPAEIAGKSGRLRSAMGTGPQLHGSLVHTNGGRPRSAAAHLPPRGALALLVWSVGEEPRNEPGGTAPNGTIPPS